MRVTTAPPGVGVDEWPAGPGDDPVLVGDRAIADHLADREERDGCGLAHLG